MTRTTIAITFLAITLMMVPFASLPAFANHSVSSGETTVSFNGNCYAYIEANGIDFAAAFVDAQTKSVNGVSGHLATFTDAAEESAADASGNNVRGWIGFTQDGTYATAPLTTPTGEPAGDYGWIDATSIAYLNWAAGEPNNVVGGTEDYTDNNWDGDKWNDEDLAGFQSLGYYVEFDGVCFIVDIDIDIKPGSDPSSVNCKSTKGSVPVAVFGSANLDVSTIDLNSLELNGDPVTEVHDKIHIEGNDAVLHLDKAGVCDATSSAVDYPLKESRDATLTGSTTTGVFAGTGDIRIANR